jgi:hypothetical protein
MGTVFLGERLLGRSLRKGGLNLKPGLRSLSKQGQLLFGSDWPVIQAITCKTKNEVWKVCVWSWGHLRVLAQSHEDTFGITGCSEAGLGQPWASILSRALCTGGCHSCCPCPGLGVPCQHGLLADEASLWGEGRRAAQPLLVPALFSSLSWSVSPCSPQAPPSCLPVAQGDSLMTIIRCGLGGKAGTPSREWFPSHPVH